MRCALCRDLDWASTPPGPVSSWPQSLRTAVDICLSSAVASYLWWGPELVQIYNDAAIDIVRSKHPASLGLPAHVTRADVWPSVGRMIERVLATGNAVRGDDVPMLPERHRAIETAWFTFSYSPVRDEMGEVAGVFCTALETTTRVRAEAALGASELRYRALATAASDVIYRMSPDWREMRELDGRGFLSDTPEPSGAWIARYIHPDDQARVTEAIDDAIQNRRRFALKHRVIRADGTLGWTMSRAVPVLGAHGEIVEWIGTATDITTSVDADAALRASEARQAYLLRLGDALRPLADPVAIQRAAASLLGEYLGVTQVRYGEAAGDVEAAIITTAGRRPVIAVPLVKDGRWVATLTAHSIAPREWTADEIGLVEETAERTWAAVERARADSARHDSEARFRTVAELAPALLWEMDPTGPGIFPLTGRWGEYTGQSSEDAQRGGWLDSIHPDDRSRTARVFEEAFATGQPLENEQRIRRHDGVYRWFLVRQLPIQDTTGRVTRWLGVAADIHEQRLAFEAGERLVADRTAERDTLRRELAEVEEAERRRLARELHDELGQDVTAFRLGLDDAMRLAGERTPPNVALAERLGQLQVLAERMTLGVRAIALELRPPELDDVGLAAALETYVADWTARYGVAADVAVIGARDGVIPAEVGSALYRIAQEALTNVAKHAGAKQVSIILEQPDHEVRLIVEDDGRGFDPAEAATRGRLERRLGLPGMQERAALVGGTVTVESSPGAGTSLFARLPTRPRVGDAERGGAARDPAGQA